MGNFLRRILLVSAVAVLAGCASLDFDYPKSESHALTDTADTTLGRGIAEHTGVRTDSQSGFYPVYDGIDSLALRLLMAQRAERSIDAQYFLIHDDLVGNAFVHALMQAADRGVRVRLLVDDIQAKGYDAGFAALNAHENFELRIFNPFAHRKSRALDITDFGRLSRRMHNKSFTVDNQMTLIGGRNIADEYFDARDDEKFGDLDVLAIGPVVDEVSAMFDSYWNHRASLPIQALADPPDYSDRALAILNEKVSRSLEEVNASQYADAVRSSILEYVQKDASAFIWADYELVYDSPDKSNPDAELEDGSIVVQLRESIGNIQEELFVVTPYFVLRKDNVAGFQQLRDENVNVTVLTNSLSSNNHTVSHSGYSPHRKKLLKMGVELHELRANPEIPGDHRVDPDSTKSTLHAKAFAVDRERLFIGSFNWNQRSVNLDTELGVIIHSPELATQFVDSIREALPEIAYEVYLNEKNKLRWKGLENGQEIILTKEPQTGFWHRFTAGFMRILPIKSQL